MNLDYLGRKIEEETGVVLEKNMSGNEVYVKRKATLSSTDRFEPTKHGYYFRCKNISWWTDDLVKKIRSILISEGFEPGGFSDTEWDDDRTWPASFTLFIIPVEEEMNSLLSL